MAAGDPYYTCENQSLSPEQVFRDMIYNDGNDNPVINLNPAGSSLEPWYGENCNNQNMTTAEVLRRLIVQDAQGKPVLNVATS